jgi:hypothetical protein
MYRPRHSDEPESLVETPEIIQNAKAEKAAIAKGWRHGDPEGSIERYLIKNHLDDEAGRDRWRDNKAEQWSTIRKWVPAYIREGLPERYSDGCEERLKALMAERESPPQPPSIQARKAGELAHRWDMVPARYNENLKVHYSEIERVYSFFTNVPGALSRFQQLAKQTAHACGYRGPDPVRYWLDVLRPSTGTNRVEAKDRLV